MTSVEQIKERLGIVDVVSSYIKLEKAGANLKGKCPFHNEKTPSFFVSPARNSYYCFGCGAKGDIFTFIEEFEGLDFMGALKVLALRAGVELTRENPKTKTERERLYSVLEHATFFFQQKLSETKEALLYLKKRGLKIETVRDWRLGFAPNEWRALSSYLQEKGFSESEMEKAREKIECAISQNGHYTHNLIGLTLSSLAGKIGTKYAIELVRELELDENYGIEEVQE